MIHTKESIQELLTRSDTAVIRAMQAIHARQTEDEQRSGTARERNGIGFNKFDAEILTSFLNQINAGRTLSYKQMRLARSRMKSYHRQLIEIANGTEEIERVKELRESGELVKPTIIPSVSGDGVRYANHCRCEDFDGERKCDLCVEREFDLQIQQREALDEQRRMEHKFGAGSW